MLALLMPSVDALSGVGGLLLDGAAVNFSLLADVVGDNLEERACWEDGPPIDRGYAVDRICSLR